MVEPEEVSTSVDPQEGYHKANGEEMIFKCVGIWTLETQLTR